MSAVLEVFDPAMCCSTGVCGPDVDPALVRFAQDLEWLAAQGVEVRRHNLAHEPAAFAGRPAVAAALKDGIGCLPMVLVDGEEVARGAYPVREELARRLGLSGPAPGEALPGALLAELCALAAAVAAGSEPAFRLHLAAAGSSGASAEQVRVAVGAARSVGRELRDAVDAAVTETLDGPPPAEPAASHPLLILREAGDGACCAPGEGSSCC
ncbi:MAG: arsenite efflux transporter metallochaperone ArsD [Thermoleophilia bacterium]|jgi:alkylhydroperoxidase/carboxymuconolactone decarboxylase family protein YurZ|nr:arsenite efflux transporter metallochaperone ArsD [Thermoleophilia bacterium]